MKNAPLQSALVLLGAWLATLGACGRTEPELADTYGNAAQGGDETFITGGTSQGGTSGASNSAGGSHTGGSSHTTGGTQGHGGDGTGTGGSPETGGTGVGGSNVAGVAGVITETGGTFFTGGTSNGGERGNATGGDTNQTGGSANGGSGGSNATGGTAGDAMGGSSGMPGGISCDGMLCDASASVCCKRRGSPSTCEPAGTTCSGGATLNCSGPSTCGMGEVCCFHANRSVCQATCDVSVGSRGNPPTIVLCDSDADCDGGQVCVIAPRGIAYCATSQ